MTRGALHLFLSGYLKNAGANVEVCKFDQAKPDDSVYIVLSDLYSPTFAKLDPTKFDIVKSIFLRSKGVLWVTREHVNSALDPNACLVTGFARTARAEADGGNILTLDLDEATSLSAKAAA